MTCIVVQLQEAVSQNDVEGTQRLAESLGELAKVESPHGALIVPEMLLGFTSLLLNNSKSLRFLQYAAKHF